MLTGEVPPYYSDQDITTDPRDLYFNLDDGDLQYYQASRMKENSLWRCVVDCFDDTGTNVFEIAKQLTQNDQEAFQLAQRYNDNLTRLRQIRGIDLPEQIVPIRATIDDAIDIFDRVNSQGTKLNEHMDALIAEPEVMHERSIADLITFGESATLEFKSTLQWDLIQNQINKGLRFSVLKTIVAFLNSEGGTLVIGVEDNGAVFGLRRDLRTVRGQSLDGFEQLLSSLIGDRIGVEFARSVKIRFEQVDGEVICAVDVDKAPGPAFMTGPRGKDFFIRHGNTTRALDPEEMHRYVQMNWE